MTLHPQAFLCNSALVVHGVTISISRETRV